MYKVRTDLPAPGRARQLKYPWDRMRPGDSFDIPVVESPAQRNALYSSARSYAKARGIAGFAIRVRQLPDGGLRVWRVS